MFPPKKPDDGLGRPREGAPVRSLHELRWPQLDRNTMAKLMGLYGSRAFSILESQIYPSHPGKADLRSALENPHLRGDFESQIPKMIVERANGGRTAGPVAESSRFLSLPTVQDALTRVVVGLFFEELGLEFNRNDLARGNIGWRPRQSTEWVLVPPSIRPVPGSEEAWALKVGPQVHSVAWTANPDVLTISERQGVDRTKPNSGTFWSLRDKDHGKRELIEQYLRQSSC